MLAKVSKSGHRPDYFLLALIFLLVVFGLAMLSSASSNLGKIKFNDTYYYLKHQLLYGLSVGLIGFVAGYLIYYQRYRKLSLPFLLISIIFLVLVFSSFGVKANNATRWLSFGPISFQPAEIMKITFVIYVAAWLSNQKTKRDRSFFEGFLPLFLVSGLIAALLFLQPATSTVVILLFAGVAVYFLSGAKMKYIIAVGFIGTAVLGLLIYSTPYRRQRVLGFLNPQKDVQGANYQVNQALIAIGSGGVWGIGYGKSQSTVNYLPAAIDDSIFAIIGEELGFVGSASLALLFAFLVFRLFWLAHRSRDRFGRLILVGFAAIIALQSLVNMAAISGLIPLTGVPLPFISYGGTALAVFLTMSGIAVNISKYA